MQFVSVIVAPWGTLDLRILSVISSLWPLLVADLDRAWASVPRSIKPASSPINTFMSFLSLSWSWLTSAQPLISSSSSIPSVSQVFYSSAPLALSAISSSWSRVSVIWVSRGIGWELLLKGFRFRKPPSCKAAMSLADTLTLAISFDLFFVQSCQCIGADGCYSMSIVRGCLFIKLPTMEAD